MMSGERAIAQSVISVRCSSGVKRVSRSPSASRPSGSMSASGQLPGPRQGVQFGFKHEDNGNQRSATLTPRRKSDFSYLDVEDIDVPFRVGSSGVVDIRRLSAALAEHDETGAGDGLDSAEYALQLIRFPWRQVFGEVQVPPISAMFRATVAYEPMVNATFKL